MSRSTRKEMQDRYDAILAFAREQEPVTVRQIYYSLASKSLVPKDNNGYQKVARACQKSSVVRGGCLGSGSLIILAGCENRRLITLSKTHFQRRQESIGDRFGQIKAVNVRYGSRKTLWLAFSMILHISGTCLSWYQAGLVVIPFCMMLLWCIGMLQLKVLRGYSSLVIMTLLG